MNHNVKGSMTKLIALVLSLGFAQEAAGMEAAKPAAAEVKAETAAAIAQGKAEKNARTYMQAAELVLTIADLPVAVLANNAEKANTRSSHILKMVDDVLVIAGQGASMYNKTRDGLDYKDSLRYKALEVFFRTADLAKHATILAKKCPVAAQEADSAEVTEMRKKLVVAAQVLRKLVAPVVQTAARGYVAYNTEDTKEASKKRLMLESLAFLTNRLSDYVAAPKASLESDAQLVATMASIVMLLVDYKRDVRTSVKQTSEKRAIKEAGTPVTTFVEKKDDKGRVVKNSQRKRTPVKRYTA